VTPDQERFEAWKRDFELSEVARESADKGFELAADHPAAVAVRAIIVDLKDRRGIKWEWDAIESDIKRTIVAVWQACVTIAYERNGSGPACVKEALGFAESYGGIDGEHHKTWVIDQMVRALTGKRYATWVAEMKDGEDGPNTYEWNEGIAP
jgi:hypothetical protein